MHAPIIETRAGKVRGLASQIHGQVMHSYLGVHYGESTAGANRFRAPQPVMPWAGVRDAMAFGLRCPQGERQPSPFDWYFPEGSASEDCLHLNVFSAEGAKRKPVMVWIHGGGFNHGGVVCPMYDGRNLAQFGDVVVVTITHRIGVLGYLDLGSFDSSACEAGNVGMLDLMASLQWIRDNIVAFGGDPDNVTLFGQSGGAGKISTLIAMPAAEGLFHKAVMQSGLALSLRDREQSKRYATAVLSHLSGFDRSAKSLREAPLEALIKAGTLEGTRFAAFVDGVIVPGNPCDPAAPMTSRKVSVMTGTTADEAAFFYASDIGILQRNDPHEVRQRIMEVLHSDSVATDELLTVYRRERPGATPVQLLLAMESDFSRRVKGITYAERRSASVSAPVYMYFLTWKTTGFNGVFGAPHTLCVPLVFRNLEVASPLLDTSSETLAISDALCNAWVAFARNGDPNHGAAPHWPPYRTPERMTMIFDRELKVVSDPLPLEWRAMASHGYLNNYVIGNKTKASTARH